MFISLVWQQYDSFTLGIIKASASALSYSLLSSFLVFNTISLTIIGLFIVLKSTLINMQKPAWAIYQSKCMHFSYNSS